MKKKMLVGMLVVCTAVVAMAKDFSKELAELKAGTRKVAMASWWGFDKKDATKCLQAAINSGVESLVVDNTGSDWIVTPIKTVDNQTIIFQDGVVLRAKKGEFKGLGDVLLDLTDRKNVTIIGVGDVSFVMNKSDYRQAKLYKHAEWRHTLRIYNAENIIVRNLSLRSSGGDGIYLGASKGRKLINILLEKLRCVDHYRQGISITGGGEHILIKDCVFNKTEGTAPQCGLDYEPNYPDGALKDCVFENCEFNDNGLAGICISCPHLQESFSLTFKNCRINGNNTGVLVCSNGANEKCSVPGKLEFIDCSFENNKYGSFMVNDHRMEKMALILKNCVIDNRKSSRNPLSLSSGGRGDLFGITIDGLTVVDDKKRPPITFLSRFGNAMRDPIIKNVKTRDSQGNETTLDCAAFIESSQPSPDAKMFKTLPLETKKLVPLSKKTVNAGEKIRYRQKFTYAVFAKKGLPVKIKFTNKPVHRFKGRSTHDPLEVAVFHPTMAPLDTLYVPFDKSLDYTLNPAMDGVYLFKCDARIQTLTVECDAPSGPLAEESLYMIRCSGILYFQVPAGVAKIMIEATGVRREESSVCLRNAEGKIVCSAVKIAGTKLLVFTRPNASKSEVWSVKFTASKLFLRIGAPLTPIFSAAPENILTVTK